jgi:4-alpha-glucanotransferase
VPGDADLEALVPLTYVDASRRLRTVSQAARAAVLAAMGGSVGAAAGGLPSAHALRCHLPTDLRAWGWAVQLATVRSTRSWGIGDLGDLRELAAWSASEGAGFVAVGPLSAPNPGPDPDPSPYFPSTRRWGNPIFLRIGELPGAVLDREAEGLALNAARLVDRRRVLAIKADALARTFARGAFDHSAFHAWRGAQGDSLERWAIYNVLAARHGAHWRRWPASLHQPDGVEVRRVAATEPDAVAFHAWVQWCFDLQLADASARLPRIADLPVGFDPGGFDAWEWQALIADTVTIGVPPDRFNRLGQSWGMRPFVPHRLQGAGYEPFVDTIRAQLRHAGGLRFDHVLGLFRQWWIPDGADPSDGAYVRQPTAELLEIVAAESVRARALIVGEDLGTVPVGVRPELRRRDVLSTRLAYFERVPPERYPARIMAAVTTHDLPTVAGAWSGSDLADQAAAGVVPDAAGAARLRARLAAVAGVGTDASVSASAVARAAYRRLAASPAMLVAATLEDALAVAERPNIPGTVPPQRANWSMALPVTVDGLGADPRVRALVEALARL